METGGVREEQHLWDVCQDRFSSVSLLSDPPPPTGVSHHRCFQTSANAALECGTDLKAVISRAIVQLPALNHAHSRPSGRVSQRGLGDSSLGLHQWKALILGKRLTPAPSCSAPAPSLLGSPLYMDMFYFYSSFLLAALSAAQQGTNSPLIGTYLGNVRNPIFLSPLLPPSVLLLPSAASVKLSSFYL